MRGHGEALVFFFNVYVLQMAGFALHLMCLKQPGDKSNRGANHGCPDRRRRFLESVQAISPALVFAGHWKIEK
jgi:hypothetical protein